ncbi:E3 ubiquitin/ISG15 ligase TRIM25-like [Morone saxatilis]|uniref:E3 ubiquitin/ISG15 ligase TRIM25-like n=1 Tax=Morone saxatilis TaxID=34816 RepID=UPI0015E1FB5C|nr:E3 ubiquitin/ISG15 ligase TRIM25-like [Morone saxatilis]
MSSFSVLASLPEDHFQCSICLNVYSDPVTTPCGHNFCKTCLNEHWDKSCLCHCPVCNKRFHVRPEISTNVVIEEISVQIKKRKAETPESADAPWQVTCDVCTGIKFKALKSCLVCLTSYCEAHLEPHQRVPSLMRHRLTDPVENLEERICEKHQRLLEFFCRNEQVCICLLCSETDHRDHETVPVEEEGARQKENIESKEARIKVMIEDRMEKIKEFTYSSEMSREKANKEIDDCNTLFNALMMRVQEAHTKLKRNIEEKLRKSQDRDKAMIEELQEEIFQLQRTCSELEELSQSDNHLHLLQTLQALSTISVTKNWSEIRVYSDLCVQTVRRAMTHLVHTFQADLKTLTETELTKMRQYKETVTFDPATAGCFLVVCEFGKCLKYSIIASPSSSDDSKRFDYPMILGTKGFSSGRHYWEVQVGLRGDWDVGVAKETVNRAGKITLKKENGFFAIGKRGFDYRIHCTKYTVLHLCPRPRKIGVYLDYNEGRVSFYDVDRKLNIYSFTGECFAKKLFPYFYLCSKGKKSETLVITSVYTVFNNQWNTPSSVHADTTPKQTRGACAHMQKQTISIDLMSEPPKCCICLDEFTSPASLPCGHRFCLACIGEYWRINGAWQCPLCKAIFPTRPQLKTDQTLHAGASTEEATVPLKAGEVPCDFCPAKHRAVKSCLECMASYCVAHLEPHYQNEDLGRHLLISVVKNLDDSSEHRGHHIISINKEAAKKKVKLKRRKMKLQQAIQERLSKVEKIKISADLNGENPKEAWAQNKELTRQLEEEISELQRRNSELEQFSQTEDNLHFLQNHSSTERLKGHKLVEPVKNLDERACLQHGRPLELYSRKKEKCICVRCIDGGEEVVSTEDEWNKKKLQQKIQKRKTRMDEINTSLKKCKDQMDDEWWDIEGVFTAVIAIVERAQAAALQPLKDRRQVVEKDAKDLIEELEAEINRLEKTISELDDISALEDHIHFLQSYPSLQDLDNIKDWTEVEFDTSLSFGTMRKTTAALLEQIQQELEKLTSIELQRVPKFTVDVKLDPTTGHQRLVLSDDGKEVKDGGEDKEVDDTSERFDLFASILGLNRLTSGRSYWEVEVSKKTGWDLGVARCDANRKGKLSLNPDNGYWVTVHYEDEKYAAMTAPPVCLSLKEKPQRVGVFVDYEEHFVSFYNVTAKSHIYSFTECSFNDSEIFPYFSPHAKQDEKNNDPLIIVN